MPPLLPNFLPDNFRQRRVRISLQELFIISGRSAVIGRSVQDTGGSKQRFCFQRPLKRCRLFIEAARLSQVATSLSVMCELQYSKLGSVAALPRRGRKHLLVCG